MNENQVLYYSVCNPTELCRSIVSAPQLYGATQGFLFTHLLPSHGTKVRLAEFENRAELEQAIDDDTRALFCDSKARTWTISRLPLVRRR
jgi:O-acetylhomoserine (thiol)-lyase